MVNQETSRSSENSTSQSEEKVTLSSKKKWFWLGVVIALLNPIFSGLLFGIALLTEPELKREGKIILFLSFAWGIIFIYLSSWMVEHGYLPR